MGCAVPIKQYILLEEHGADGNLLTRIIPPKAVVPPNHYYERFGVEGLEFRVLFSGVFTIRAVRVVCSKARVLIYSAPSFVLVPEPQTPNPKRLNPKHLNPEP